MSAHLKPALYWVAVSTKERKCIFNVLTKSHFYLHYIWTLHWGTSVNQYPHFLRLYLDNEWYFVKTVGINASIKQFIYTHCSWWLDNNARDCKFLSNNSFLFNKHYWLCAVIPKAHLTKYVELVQWLQAVCAQLALDSITILNHLRYMSKN